MARSDDAQFEGFLRPNGTVGVRNYVAVIPSVFCANSVAQKISEPFDNVVALCHSLDCSHMGMDLELASRTLKRLGQHPNVGAVLGVGLGPERLMPCDLVQAIIPTGKPVEQILVEQEGSLIPAVDEDRAIVECLLRKLRDQPRVKCRAESLTIAVASEGLDASTLLAASPSKGMAVNTLIDLGGTVVFSETEELLGAEDAIAGRAISPDIAAEATSAIGLAQNRLRGKADIRAGTWWQVASRVCLIGGITTVRERGLGSLAKSGSSTIAGVLEYAELIPHRPGVFLMDGPMREAESVTGMLAGGAQIVVLSTCHGTPAGCPIAPVIKVSGSPGVHDLMSEDIDINAGTVLKGTGSLEETGQQIWQSILDTASGKHTQAELSGNRELFAVWQGR